MKIETKYEVHQKVWIFKNNKSEQKEICGIGIDLGTVRSLSGGIRVFYHFRQGFFNGGTFEEREEDVFATKEELISSL